MGRKDKKPTVPTPTPPPPPPPTTTSSTTFSSSSTSSATPVPTSTSSSSSDSPPPPPPPPPPPKSTTTPANITTLALPASSSKRPPQPHPPTTPASSKRPKMDPTSTPPGKVLFQRVWSAEDELVILNGMLEYRAHKGVDPMANVDAFLHFIKKSLHVHDANKAQIVSKVRRLKKRFLNATKKKLHDPHDLAVFELSQRIWRGPDNTEYKNKKTKTPIEEVKTGVVELDVEFGFSREEGAVLRDGVSMMGDGEKGDVQRVVEEANVAYLEAYLLKLKALEFAARKIMQGIREGRC